MKSLQIAATGMAAQQLRVDVISNNIANMSTAAYRPRVAEFSDLMYQQYLTPGTITSQVGTTVPAGIQIGTGDHQRSPWKSHREHFGKQDRNSTWRSTVPDFSK